jgi:hypothetical protein
MQQQQVFTKAFIYDRIKDSGFPCWALSMQNGFRNFANVMSYYGIDWSDEDNDETKIEKSIARLEQTLSTFPPDTNFAIEIKSGRNATGSAILGPFYFSIAEDKAEPTEDAPKDAQQQQPQLGAIPPGYVPESMLKGLEESLTKTFDARIEALKAEQAQERKEQEYRNRLERLEEREKEVKDLERSYKSDVAKGADVVVEIVKKIGMFFLMPKGAQMQPDMQQQLGAAQQPTPQHQANDPKADAVDDFAAFLYNNYTVEDIQKLKSNIINYSQNAQQTDMAQPGEHSDAAADEDID